MNKVIQCVFTVGCYRQENSLTGLQKSISSVSFPVKDRRHDCDQETARNYFFQPLCYCPYGVSLFYIKAKFLLYIFVFRVLDGSISYSV